MTNIRLFATDGANIRLRPLPAIRNYNIRCYPVPVGLPGDVVLMPIMSWRDSAAIEIFEWTEGAWARCPAYVWTGAAWVGASVYVRLAGRWGQINTSGMEM